MPFQKNCPKTAFYAIWGHAVSLWALTSWWNDTKTRGGFNVLCSTVKGNTNAKRNNSGNHSEIPGIGTGAHWGFEPGTGKVQIIWIPTTLYCRRSDTGYCWWNDENQPRRKENWWVLNHLIGVIILEVKGRLVLKYASKPQDYAFRLRI